MSGAHARLSPSGADGWMNCSQWMNDSEGSVYARRGNAMHDLAELVLERGHLVHEWKHQVLNVEGQSFVVDDEMVDIVSVYVDYIRGFKFTHELFVEVKVPIDHLNGEAEATGTADAILLAHDESEVVVVDLKTGRGVEVDAVNNLQGLHYASGAMRFAKAQGINPRSVRIVICQPPVSRTPSEWEVSFEELEAFEQRARQAAERHGSGEATPGAKQCQWCSRKPNCAVLAARVQAELGAQFEDLTTEDKSRRDELVAEMVARADISAALAAADLIETWCSAIRAEAERRLHNGIAVDGFKLVAGKRGVRNWCDASEAEEMLRKKLRLKVAEAFDLKLISPATAEKRLKGKPKHWARLLPLISQTEGKPTVAPMSDKRPAVELKPVVELFDDHTGADLA